VSQKAVQLFITDSLPFFNPVTNGQSIAVICEQIELSNKEFDILEFYIKMPQREEGGVNGQFTKKQFLELRELYFNDSLRDFYNELLTLNWKTRKHYDKNFMTLIDRVNMTFQDEIRKNFSKQFPGGTDWYGYNAFIVLNKYMTQSGAGTANNIVNSLNSDPNEYLVESDTEKLMRLLKKYKD
jgi:hypothetical protein